MSSNALLQALQQAMGGGAPAAAAPPAQPAAAPAEAGAISGNALMQALQAAMGAAAGGAHAPLAQAAAQLAAMQPPPQQQQQQQAQQAAAAGGQRGDKHAMTRKPAGPPPAWTKNADSWAAPTPAPDHALLPSAEAAAKGSPLQQAVSAVLGQEASLGTSPSGPPGAVHLLLVPATPGEPGGALKLTSTAADQALARIPPGSSLVLALQAAWLRAAEAAAAPGAGEAPGVRAALGLLQARAAAKAAAALAADEDDDLFFTGGRQRGAFYQALVRACRAHG